MEKNTGYWEQKSCELLSNEQKYRLVTSSIFKEKASLSLSF